MIDSTVNLHIKETDGYKEIRMEWARTETCVEDCHSCGNTGRFFQYDSDAVVHRWLCLDCYEIEVSYCTCRV